MGLTSSCTNSTWAQCHCPNYVLYTTFQEVTLLPSLSFFFVILTFFSQHNESGAERYPKTSYISNTLHTTGNVHHNVDVMNHSPLENFHLLFYPMHTIGCLPEYKAAISFSCDN
jgi:hypothetical protein